MSDHSANADLPDSCDADDLPIDLSYLTLPECRLVRLAGLKPSLADGSTTASSKPSYCYVTSYHPVTPRSDDDFVAD